MHVHMLPAVPGDTNAQPASGNVTISALPVSDAPHSNKSPPPVAAAEPPESREGVDPQLVASLNEKLSKLAEVLLPVLSLLLQHTQKLDCLQRHTLR